MKNLDLDDLELVSGGLRVGGGLPGAQGGLPLSSRFGGDPHADDFGLGRDGQLYVSAGMHPQTLDAIADELRSVQPRGVPMGANPGAPVYRAAGIPGIPAFPPGVSGFSGNPFGLPTATPAGLGQILRGASPAAGGASPMAGGSPLGALTDLLGGKGPFGSLVKDALGGAGAGGGRPSIPGIPGVPIPGLPSIPALPSPAGPLPGIPSIPAAATPTASPVPALPQLPTPAPVADALSGGTLPAGVPSPASPGLVPPPPFDPGIDGNGYTQRDYDQVADAFGSESGGYSGGGYSDGDYYA